MNTIRAFLAIMLPSSTQPIFSALLEELSTFFPENKIRWTKVEQLHITLQFIQNLPLEKIADLIQNIQINVKNIPNIKLEFGKLEWFPSPEHPKLLSLSVGPQDILKNLAEKLEQPISELNQPVESLPFRAHMTLGRLNNRHSSNENLLKIPLPTINPIQIDKIYLVESKPIKYQTNYIPLAQFDLSNITT